MQDLVALAERWVSAADVADWILIGAGIVAIWLAWRMLSADVRLGTVEVSSDKEDGLDAKQIAALREELANAGLLPAGGVPAGTPRANVVAAIEKAPVPQAPWLAALASLVPEIRSNCAFDVSVTLRDQLGDNKDQVGVTYQISRQGSRTSLGVDTAYATDVSGAIGGAANATYRKIVASTPNIFPAWSVWPDERSFAEYRRGAELEKLGRSDAAFECFKAAEALAPRNMLARLSVANRLERQAAGSPIERTPRRIEALDAYLKVAELETSIYEAHYRAMVLLSVLADTWCADDAAYEGDLRSAMERTKTPLPRERKALAAQTDDAPNTDDPTPTPPEKFKRLLRDASRHEAKAANKLLGVTWTVLHEGRLRHRFELSGPTRRKADKALATSRLTLRLRRQWPGSGEIPWGTKVAWRYWWRARMRLRFAFMREGVGWQAHYNAACFYALLPETTADPPLSDSEWLCERAYRHLARAFGDPKADLDDEYVRHDDPDLELLRADQVRWRRKLDAIVGREAIIHYHRPNAHAAEYREWGLHLWGEGVRQGARTDWPMTRGPGHVTADQAEFWVPVGDQRRPISFVIHAGEKKDCGIGISRLIHDNKRKLGSSQAIARSTLRHPRTSHPRVPSNVVTAFRPVSDSS